MIIRAGSLVSAARMQALRSQFPVLERLAYLNAGTNGPVPARAVEAVEASVRRQAEEGRAGTAFFEESVARADGMRGRVAALLGADTAELTLTGSTTDGVNAVLNALDLRPGDEILTSDEEHPGVLAPLARARDAYGARVRLAPFAELADAVGPGTRLVACSHVSWLTGRVVDAPALAAGGAELLLDGAQGLGALPVDVRALGCDYYAASGQKWLCGPNGVGYLYVRAGLLEGLRAPWPGYHSLLEPGDALESPSKPDARKLGNGFPAHHQLEWAHAALDVLEEAGMAALQERAAGLADSLATRLAEFGVRVTARGRQPLVSFEAADPPALVERLASSERMVLRDLPGTPYVRASVGAWTDRGRARAARAGRRPVGRPRSSTRITIPKTIEPTTASIASDPRTPNAAACATRPSRLESTARVLPRIATPNAQVTPMPATSDTQITCTRSDRSTIRDDHPDASAGSESACCCARRTNRSAPPARISADTITGPAAPVPKSRVTP